MGCPSGRWQCCEAIVKADDKGTVPGDVVVIVRDYSTTKAVFKE